jgi:hypothetical protein
VKAADTAMKAELPILDWIALSVNPVPDGTAPTPITVQTMGAAAFIGHEVIMPLCRVPAPDAAFLVCAATEMLIQRGHVFRDSDTMGDDANRRMIRIRHWPEGKMGAQTDMWALLHPTFARSEDDLFGERALKPPPPGIDNSIRGDADSLKRKLYAFVAGLRR